MNSWLIIQEGHKLGFTVSFSVWSSAATNSTDRMLIVDIYFLYFSVFLQRYQLIDKSLTDTHRENISQCHRLQQQFQVTHCFVSTPKNKLPPPTYTFSPPLHVDDKKVVYLLINNKKLRKQPETTGEAAAYSFRTCGGRHATLMCASQWNRLDESGVSRVNRSSPEEVAKVARRGNRHAWKTFAHSLTGSEHFTASQLKQLKCESTLLLTT